jgi:hypothetical protein
VAVGPLAVLALAAASCGGDGSVEDAAQGYVDALQAGDFAEACTYFTEEELDERMGGAEQCEKSMAATTGDPHALDGFEITGTHEGEEGATIVEFTFKGDKPNEFSFKQEDGEWKFFED